METTVRYIPSETAVVEGKTYSVGNKIALCFRGKTHAVGIINSEEGVIPVEMDLRAHDQSPLVYINNRTDEYPVSKFITHLQRITQDKPISPECLKLIQNWPNNGEDFDSEPVPDWENRPIITRRKKKVKSNCIPAVATEHHTTSQKVRKFLRSKGLHAPYDNEDKIRSLMQDFNKG